MSEGLPERINNRDAPRGEAEGRHGGDGWDGLVSRMDPVPAHVVAAAKASLSWRDPDAELAALVEQHGLAEVRGEHAMLTFESGSLTIEVEVLGRSLAGQIVPPQAARVRLDHGGGDPLWTSADALGRFAFDTVAPGHIRLTCYPETGGAVRTAWTRV
ncbi:hypothetical protein [Allorhizocola rhizosphaerae]|uniref:hypothetical protein n=1 Tax=Allorhizocola rhizosphaerae TaxID=1872709 RepID=UPI001FE33A58|nr:hypothetical protein [Allorhizocola rhizosphaerae]